MPVSIFDNSSSSNKSSSPVQHRRKLGYDELVAQFETNKRERIKEMFNKACQIKDLIKQLDLNNEDRMLSLFIEYSVRFGYINQRQFELTEGDKVKFMKLLYNQYASNMPDCSARLKSSFKGMDLTKLRTKSVQELKDEVRINATIESFKLRMKEVSNG